MTRRRLPTPDERRLWRIAMRDAEPMPGRAIEAEPEPLATMAELVEEPVATSLAPPPTAKQFPGPARPSRAGPGNC
ncbi:DNA mismatch repair protein MutS, partial [Azospirillum melinis]|nr:DNA mismatch repair protein MutS [Azospirillum melinis]